MSPAEVIAYMQTSRNEEEWNKNYDEVCKRGINGNWWEIMMMSGIANKIRQGWLGLMAKGLLKDLTPGYVNNIELLPPDEAEIEAIKAERNAKRTQ